jgi:succinylarginine dihydrolase
VADRNVLLVHEDAWENVPEAVSMLGESLAGLRAIVVKRDQVPLADAIKSYLFNSQLVALPDGSTSLVAPVEAAETESVRRFIEQLVAARDPIRSVHFIDVRQSMRNGGGPACLRLRVTLNETELAATHQGVIFTDSLYEKLRDWIERRYRDELAPADLADPKLLEESHAALDELTQILGLGSIYEFQG